MLRFYNTAKDLINQTHTEGGTTTFTFNVLPEDKQGQLYVVGDGLHEVKVSCLCDYEQQINTLALYLNCFLFDVDADTIGTWYNDEDGQIYLDTGKLFSNLDEAILFAKEHNELAIFDYTNKEVIDVH